MKDKKLSVEAQVDLLRRVEELEKQAVLKEGLPHLFGMKLYKWAHDYIESTNKMNLLCAANQISKALADDTEIPTPSGFVRMGELKVGDEVYSRDGKPVKVVAVPFKGVAACFNMIFSDGVTVAASGDHRWVCKTSRERFRRSYVSSGSGREFENPSFDQWVELSTLEIIEAGGYGGISIRPWNRVSVPVCAPVQRVDKGLFDPYLVGLLIGDGGLTSGSVMLSSADSEIAEYVVSRYGAVPSGRFGYRLNGYQDKMREIGLMGCGSLEKHIPKPYLEGSVEERLQLLRGLMDTDGTISATAMAFSTISSRLRDDFVELVSSLGGRSKVKKRKAGYRDKEGVFVQCNDVYNVRINIPLCPFSLRRKAEKFRLNERRHERVLYSVAPLGEKPSTCVTVEGDGTFLATRDYLVTHNSSTNIRKAIKWATSPNLWKGLWSSPPRQFWYMYPSMRTCHDEFNEKWVKEWLPRGDFKNHPIFGWKAIVDQKKTTAVRFNSGVTIYFKSYEQDVRHLQTSSVHAIFGDEEMPVEVYNEVIMRGSGASIEGYFHLVFTATLGQDFWREAIEEKGEKERFPRAFKQQISMYDCMHYMDGSPSPWTVEKVENAKAKCRSEAEILRRIYGRFVLDEGLKYECYSSGNFVKPYSIPQDWDLYAGVDIGSGGKTGHPGAIVFVAVRPDFQKGAVYLGWRGDKVDTTAGDILQEFKRLKGSKELVAQYYDWNSKDFFNIATRVGEPFIPAEKSHAVGEDTLNVLFKHGMLDIFNNQELQKLDHELKNLKRDTPKVRAKDDFTDALRYAVTKIPWDFTRVAKDTEIPRNPVEPTKKRADMHDPRGQMTQGDFQKSLENYQDEFDEANELMGYDW